MKKPGPNKNVTVCKSDCIGGDYRGGQLYLDDLTAVQYIPRHVE